MHLVIVAVLAGLVGNALDQFLMDSRLVDGPVVFGIMALKTAAVGHHAPVARLLAFLQEQGFLGRFDGLIGISFEVLDQLLEGRFIHRHPALEIVIVMAAGAIVVIGRRSRLLPLADRLAHLVADHTGEILSIADRQFMGADGSRRDENDQDQQSDFGHEKLEESFDHLTITLPVFYDSHPCSIMDGSHRLQ